MASAAPVLSESRRQLRVISCLGRGGFGTVYLVDLLSAGGFQKRVAIKIANAGTLEASAGARLLDEARMLGLVRHRAIVAVEGLISLDGRPAMLMEYIHGVSLARLSENGPVPPRVVLEILRELAAALHAAWSTLGPDGRPLQLVHRDIKPANILLTPQGEVKLLDFGIARAEIGSRSAQTTVGAVAGSLEYLAPERTETGGFGPAADIYALGSVLYELIRGEPIGQLRGNQRQFERTLDGRLNLLAAVLGAESPIVALVGNMLAWKPESRPTAREVRRDCDRLFDRMEGERLVDWAEQNVPPLLEAPAPDAQDARTGQTFSEEHFSLESMRAQTDGGDALDAVTRVHRHAMNEIEIRTDPMSRDLEEPTELAEVVAEQKETPAQPTDDARKTADDATAATDTPRPIRRILKWVTGLTGLIAALAGLVAEGRGLLEKTGLLQPETTPTETLAAAAPFVLPAMPTPLDDALPEPVLTPYCGEDCPAPPLVAEPLPEEANAKPPPRGTVRLRGQATQAIFTRDRTVMYRLNPGDTKELKVGTYRVFAQFEDTGEAPYDLGDLRVSEAASLTITCREDEHTCSW